MSRLFPGGVAPFAKVPVETAHFSLPILPIIGVAGVPGTPDPAAMGWLGNTQIAAPRRISTAHLHQIKDGAAGSNDIDLFRWRKGTGFVLIATISVANGAGDGKAHDFTITDHDLDGGDYLYAQATALITTALSAGFVDVHFEPNHLKLR